MRDQRDPTHLGEAILALRAKTSRGRLTDVVDRNWRALDRVPATRDVGPNERYGDPRLLPSG